MPARAVGGIGDVHGVSTTGDGVCDARARARRRHESATTSIVAFDRTALGLTR